MRDGNRAFLRLGSFVERKQDEAGRHSAGGRKYGLRGRYGNTSFVTSSAEG